MRRYHTPLISLGSAEYRFQLADYSSPDCPMVWWVRGAPSLKLTIQKSSDASGWWPALEWGADLDVWPRREVVVHPTAEAAAADLMDRYMSPDDSSAARLGFLAAAFGGSSSEHLEERVKAVLREAEDGDSAEPH
ncbi:hypothetical protein [Streptomyces sp. NPDC056672]|uniref:hypothetical protein n=1 Tax=Streptomyces sp. NPDC056672 TaxID=3345906 RepID=UPI0036A18489